MLSMWLSLSTVQSLPLSDMANLHKEKCSIFTLEGNTLITHNVETHSCPKMLIFFYFYFFNVIGLQGLAQHQLTLYNGLMVR